MDNLQKAAAIVLQDCIAVGNGEKLLIVTDRLEKPVSDIFFDAAKRLHHDVTEMMIPAGNVNGEEPPPDAAKKMLLFPVQLLITAKSLTHTCARENACKKGARIATMPSATKEMIERAIPISYPQLAVRNKKIAAILTKAKTAHLTTPAGTDITFSLAGRKGEPDDGIYHKRGEYGNLPAGEVFIAPGEGKTEGMYVVDASMAGMGKLPKPMRIEVKNGLAIRVTGYRADYFSSLLKSKNHRNIAELGIGTNPNAIITGNVLEDEKVMGTVHIALGNNAFFGGKVNVPFHVDGVLRDPTLTVDGECVIRRGKLLF
ncbi:aminopeptidase [Candidatus Woesearchaeota archaeon]|nr:aminopeptidase [Candidatus Woesearchaeota archaeon]